MPPIIFLDVDGVLNHRAIFQPGSGPDPLCPTAVLRLIGLASMTGANIVISSTWRLGGFKAMTVQKLWDAGIFKYVHDDWRTIDLPCIIKNGVIVGGVEGARRGREIAEWLARHPKHKNYVILDDDSDMLPEQMPRFVQTSFDTGLLEEHCERAHRILTKRR